MGPRADMGSRGEGWKSRGWGEGKELKGHEKQQARSTGPTNNSPTSHVPVRSRPLLLSHSMSCPLSRRSNTQHESLSRKKHLQHPERHLPHTCPTSWVPGCWTPRWPLPLGCEHGSDCSSECHLPPLQPVRPGQGCPHSQPPEEVGRAELRCRTECGGHGARRSDRERRWRSWWPGDSRRPA